MDSPERIGFSVSSGYGRDSQKPFINITVGAKDFHTQMSPVEAIELAHNLLAAAEAAITDAFMIRFLRERVGVDMPQVAGLLNEFREFREELDEKGELRP